MKFIKSIDSFINESVKSYPFLLKKENNDLFQYEFFDLVGNRYLVEFKNLSMPKSNNANQYELFYYVEDNGNFSVSKIVNVNPYRTIKTVFTDILNDFLRRNTLIKEVLFTGLSKDKEKEFISSRTKIYKRYLDMNPPDGFMIKQIGNVIKLTKNIKSNAKTRG